MNNGFIVRHGGLFGVGWVGWPLRVFNIYIIVKQKYADNMVINVIIVLTSREVLRHQHNANVRILDAVKYGSARYNVFF